MTKIVNRVKPLHAARSGQLPDLGSWWRMTGTADEIARDDVTARGLRRGRGAEPRRKIEAMSLSSVLYAGRAGPDVGSFRIA
jgi:hypothetical protein